MVVKQGAVQQINCRKTSLLAHRSALEDRRDIHTDLYRQATPICGLLRIDGLCITYSERFGVTADAELIIHGAVKEASG